MKRITPAITGVKKLQSEVRAAQLFDVRVYGIVCARHGHDLMGCKSPVHYLGSGHIWQLQKVLAEGKGGRVTDRLKEA